MPHRNTMMVHGDTLEALQGQSGPSRRTRPPDIDAFEADENRVPLRSEKMSRRESRLGLRNIFSRSKTVKEPEFSTPAREISKPIGVRSSVADYGNWPYGQSAPQSEPALVNPRSFRPLSTMTENPQAGQSAHRQNNPTNLVKQRSSPGKAGRGTIGTWNLPPLFKAFPQAIKYMTLPATSVPADVILRTHERKPNVLTRDDPNEPTLPSTDEREKSKKKHRRNTSASGIRFEWTNKVYVLVTSGYLLQYAGEGAFDRLPEKVLQLGKDSAAFASDVIPGRHWVVQVSSVTESDGSQTSDSRSLFSRLQFRPTERRQASNFLMVFETAEDMESWITTLRREIEALGGKKNLSETGAPKAEEEVNQLRLQPSQRTLVVRDPNRLSRIEPQGTHWQDLSDHDGSVATLTDFDTTIDPTIDDISTTNSVVSHDGRQLDNLRDSSNRLSFISSGQRTVVTSAGSSPECSPTADTFPMHFDEPQHEEYPSPTETRLRPNAAAILDRRQSMQALGQFVDFNSGMASMRPQSIYTPNASIVYPAKTPTPNFSVPHSSNRRFSYARATSDVHASVSSGIGGGELHHRPAARKAPPTTLAIARPLSMVADQPSPLEDMQERPATRHGQDTQPLSPSLDHLPLPRHSQTFETPPRRSSFMPRDEARTEIGWSTTSRRLSNMQSWRRPDAPVVPVRNFTAPLRAFPRPRLRSQPNLPANENEYRFRSSLEANESARLDDKVPRSRSLKRISIEPLADTSLHLNVAADLPTPMTPGSLPSPLPPPMAPLPPIPMSASTSFLKTDLGEKKIYNRRSMPQLSDGPPVAPPPSCALPPIPQNLATRI